MKNRIAIVADNSYLYVELLIDIWNNNDCAVLIDNRIPISSVVEMLKIADVVKCYTDSIDLYNEVTKDKTIVACVIKKEKKIQYVPEKCYLKFRDNYTSDEAVVLFSSGTSGKSKGCVLTHKAINGNADSIIKYLGLKDDVLAIVKSLAHSSSLVGELLVGLKTKSPILIGSTVISPKTLLNSINNNNVTVLFANPTLLKLYSTINIKAKIYLPELKRVYTTGAILSKSIVDLANEAFPNVKILNGYGMTECGPRVSVQGEEQCFCDGLVGKPIDGVSIKIVSENHDELSHNQIGIIMVKTPYGFSRYLNGTNNDSEWINTRDLGYKDEDGNLYIVGRADNMIITSSHNVYPEEIEQVINGISGIDDCIVVGVEDELYGEILVCIYKAEASFVGSSIFECKNKLASYETPRKYIRVDQIPTTVGGKKVRNIVQIRKIIGEII